MFPALLLGHLHEHIRTFHPQDGVFSSSSEGFNVSESAGHSRLPQNGSLQTSKIPLTLDNKTGKAMKSMYALWGAGFTQTSLLEYINNINQVLRGSVLQFG